MMSQNIPGHVLVMCLVLMALQAGAHSGVIEGNNVSTTSPASGAKVAAGMVRISGRYTGAYQIVICLNGGDSSDCHMDGADGADAGTWYYDLDTTKYDGEVEVTARGLSAGDRYPVTAPGIKIHVDNPAANIPAVTIRGPVEGTPLSGVVPVTVDVSARNPISGAQIRINGGAWNAAAWNGRGYVYKWDTSAVADTTCSLEAKAIDSLGNAGYSMTTYAKVGAGTRETVALALPDRATWIWEPAAMDLLRNPGSRLALDSFCKNTTFGEHTIKTLFLYADRYGGDCVIKESPGLYRDFIAWAHGEGYKVYALLGSSMYCAPMCAYDRYHDRAVALMESIINYNISSAANERFDGVNADIEPQGLPDWKARPVLQVQFLDMLKKMIQRRNAAGINLAFGPAVPRWLDENNECAKIKWGGSTKWEGNHIQDICDYIAVMDYRDVAGGPSGIIRHGQGEIEYANSIGKPHSVVIGVETDDCASTGDPASVTFREEGRAALEAELDKVYSTWGGIASFGGCAIHHYESFRALPSAWGEPERRPAVDATAPSAVGGTPAAATFDFQRIDLTYGYATGSTAIEGYNIYRSTTSGFPPGPSNLVARSSQNFFKDSGLLPNTTYYYRIAAVDVQGKTGPATSEVSATTGTTKRIPVRIARMDLRYGGNACTATLKAVDSSTGEGVAVAVHGRFTHMAGKYRDMKTARDGTASATSEPIESPHGRVGFTIDRIVAEGYYWASSSDTPHAGSCTW